MSHRSAPLIGHQLTANYVVLVFAGILLSLCATVTHGLERKALWISPDLCSSAKFATPSQDDKESRRLELGKPIERTIAGGQTHSYQLTLPRNQYLYLTVEQRGIDVVVNLFGPDGTKLDEIDSPNGKQGVERVMMVAQAVGDYRLELRPLHKNSSAGRYEVGIIESRPATEQDRIRVSAMQTFREADRLGSKGVEFLQKAIEKYEVALSAFRAAGYRDGEGATMLSIAQAYYNLQDARKALDHFERAARRFQVVGDRQWEGRMLFWIGTFYQSHGEFQTALDFFERALPVIQSTGDRPKEAATHLHIGDSYQSVNQGQKSIEHYNQALSLFQSLGNKFGEADALHKLGADYRVFGGQPAMDYFLRALALYQSLGNSHGEAWALIEMAFIHTVNEKQKALDLFERALQLCRTLNDTYGEAYTLYGIGRAYSAMGEHQKALKYFNQALPMWKTLRKRGGEFITIFDIARSESANGNLLTALAHVETVLNYIEAQRGKLNDQEIRASYLAGSYEPYEFGIGLLMQLHKQRPSEGHDASALRASERARARSLLELLTEARADIRKDVDPMLLKREQALQQPLTAKTERLMQLRSNSTAKEQSEAVTKEIGTVEKEIEALTTEYRRVQSQIRTTSPRYAALTQPQPLGLKEIQQLLDSETVLLEYALGEERSFLWAVSATTLQSFELPKRADVEASAKHVYQLLTARSRHPTGETSQARELRIAQADAEYPKAAAALSGMILKDVSAQLQSKRLVIVADGALQFIPFAALSDPAGLDSAIHSPLLINHEIVNLPSASTLAVLRQYLSERIPAKKAVAILADPVFDKNDMRVKTTGAAPKAITQSASSNSNALTRDIERAMEDLDDNPRFPPLRLAAAHWEGIEIGKLVPATERMQALDFAATRQTATSPELSQYRIVHFATHAFNNSAHPELSGIVLSLVNERGEPLDGFLRLSEIFNLNLPAELVVLSGCQTGLGKEVKGEGLVGMTRGFMYAGAPRLVVSLWSVDDRATSDLMARFYRRMLGGQKLSPSAALRSAQIAIWREFELKAPYFWAGFIFEGEWRQ
jgi:CHAT domain-containing protein